jgi:hypothetical protein
MKLTGYPLIITIALLALLVIAGTVLLWSRFGRWRLLTRSAGVVLAEALVVAAIGLVVNRSEDFYPSWQALRGDTGTTESTAPPPSGRLDATLAGGQSTLSWRPEALASWHLAAVPTVVLPPGYRDRPSATYPVVLVLAGGATDADLKAAMRASQHNDGVVTVIARPTAETRAAAFGRMVAALGGDVRVTGYGWALVARARDSALAAELVDGVPGQFVAEAVIGSGARPHASVALAVVHTAAALNPPPSGGPSSPGGTATRGGKTEPGKTTPTHKTTPPTHKTTPPTQKTTPSHKTGPSHRATTPGTPLSPGKGAQGRAGSTGKAVPPSVETTLTCAPDDAWKVATRWAAAQTSDPLQPAIRLPVGARPEGGPPTGGTPGGGLSAGRLPTGGHPATDRSAAAHETPGPKSRSAGVR